MIARLSGSVAFSGEHYAVLDVAGVGYKVCATPATLGLLKEGGKATLHIYTAVRENAIDLYGFLDENERRVFELLLTVSGIGPKSALAVVSLATVEQLVSAIAAGKSAYLTNISGIGKKTAEKIVLELKEKILKLGMAHVITGEDEGAFEALRTLGYSAKEARDALMHIPESAVGESARLREALKALGGR